MDYQYTSNATDGANGYLKTVSNPAVGTVYWRAMGQNAAGQLTDITLGNGVSSHYDYDVHRNILKSINSTTVGGNNDIQSLGFEFDAIGNITKRLDYNQWINLNILSETFTYDGINRMVGSSVEGQSAKAYQYDALGNIISKTGVGNYSYGLNAGPHAVTQVVNGAQTNTYSYDANGSMISGAGRTITYSSYNKPIRITNSTADIRFSYGADRARIKRSNSNTGEVRTYIGNLFERKIVQGLTTDTHYIKAAGSTVAIVNSKSDHTSTTHYLHKDHLDSITAITNEQGLVIETQSYDAHGKRRNSDWSDINGDVTPSITTDRGYTGHEHIDEVGLVHMNGRVYDSTLERFISADPTIQAPYNSQSFNRYSYVLNNPLSYTDPSGFFFKKLFKKVKNAFKKLFRGVKGFFKSILKNDILRLAISIGLAIYGIPGYIEHIMLKGFAAGLVGSGGDLKAGIVGALSAGAFDGIGTYAKNYAIKTGQALSTAAQAVKTLAHGVVGGLASVASGGQFKSGFLAAGATQAFSGKIDGIDKLNEGISAQRTIAAAALGGAASVLGGGKFANGAITEAFSRAFNDEAHIGLSAKVSDLVSKAYEFITGNKLISNGGSLGLYVSAPNIDQAGNILSGKFDVGFTSTASINEETYGIGSVRALQVGWSTASSAAEIAGIGSQATFQYGNFGVNISLDRVGFDYSVIGTGYNLGGGGTRTSVWSLRDGHIPFDRHK